MNFPSIGRDKSGSGLDGSLFIKLKSGDKVTGVFRGDPKIFKIHWVGQRSTLCEGKDLCPLCKNDDKAKFRFQLNFVTKTDGVWIAKIFEGNYQTYIALKELHESGYDLEGTSVSIKREGEKTDTRYIVMPLKNNGGLKEPDFKKIEGVPLNLLKDDNSDQSTSDSVEEDAPF